MRSLFWACVALCITTLLVGCAAAEKSYAGGGYDMDSYNGVAAMPMEAPMARMASGDEGEFGGNADMEEDYLDDGADGAPIQAKPDASQNQPGEPDKEPDQVPVPKKRLVIYRADLGLYVFDMEATLTKAEAIGDKYKGWIQQSTSSSLTLRVPAEHFEATMAELEELGDVNYRNVVGTDVTEQFYDTQIRLKNAEVLRDRYIELLRQAKTVEDSLAIERELARVTQDIELLKGKLRFLQNQIAFSTINLSLERKTQEPVKATRVPLPFGWMGQYHLDSVLR